MEVNVYKYLGLKLKPNIQVGDLAKQAYIHEKLSLTLTTVLLLSKKILIEAKLLVVKS